MATQTINGTNTAGLCPTPQRPTKKQVGEGNTMTEIFGDPIHIYTRAQAIEDGFLVDVTETAFFEGKDLGAHMVGLLVSLPMVLPPY